jgi:large repetitive protein
MINCGVISVTNDAPAVFPDGVTIVTWTVTDVANNTATCQQSVTVADIEPPMISCPTVDAFDAPPGTCSVIVNNNLAPTVTDCNDFTVTYVITGATIGSGNDDATGTEFFVGTSILTYYAEDIFGNLDSCSVTVQVNDGEAPAVFCPGDQLIFVPNGTVDTIVNNIGATSNDNCTVSSLDYQTTGALSVSGSGDISGTAFPVGTTTVTYIASDPSGNVDSCSFEVNVVEVLNQMLGCPLDQIVDNDPGECNAVVNNIEPVVLINPGDVSSIQYTLSGATTGSGTDDAQRHCFQCRDDHSRIYPYG